MEAFLRLFLADAFFLCCATGASLTEFLLFEALPLFCLT